MNYSNIYGNYPNSRYSNLPAWAMPNLTQPYMQPTAQEIANGIFFNHIRYVNKNEMASYVVLPNNTDMIIDKENGVVQIKSADQMGNSFTRNFKFEEINEQPTDKSQTEQKLAESELKDYVKKEDLADFIKTDALEAVSKQLNEKLTDLEKKIKVKEIMEGKE